MAWEFEFRPYVSVAQRRANAERELQKLSKKSGTTVSPVVLEGRKIAGTFWGKAWCDNLEVYSDFASRLPRGRSYVRNGSVVDLQISAGEVSARVFGSELYRIKIKIKPLSAERWKSIQAECAGKVDSLLELLQGKLSSSVMEIVTKPERGLFPAPKEISLDCSCPDWADLCKHVAATLYGVGARLDTKPELLFLLRGVDPSDLIGKVSAAEAVRQAVPTDAPTMSESEMADVFGIELGSLSQPLAGTPEQVQLEGAELKKTTPRSTRVARKQTGAKRKAKRKISATAQTRRSAKAKAGSLPPKPRKARASSPPSIVDVAKIIPLVVPPASTTPGPPAEPGSAT